MNTIVAMKRRRLTGLMIALFIEYLLGVTLSTVINYDPTKHSTVQSVFLVAHIAVAIGILIGAVFALVGSLREKALVAPSVIGLLAVLGSWGSGSEASSTGSSTATFVMAICFAIAIASYGYSLFKTK
jgi:hypothetical protein